MIYGMRNFLIWGLLISASVFAAGDRVTRPSFSGNCERFLSQTSRSLDQQMSPHILKTFLGAEVAIQRITDVTATGTLVSSSKQGHEWILGLQVRKKVIFIPFHEIKSITRSGFLQETVDMQRVSRVSAPLIPMASGSSEHPPATRHSSLPPPTEILPTDDEEAFVKNELALIRNTKKTKSLLALTSDESTYTAALHLAPLMLEGHFFKLNHFLINKESAEETLNNHRHLRSRPFRFQSPVNLLFLEIVPPHSDHIEELFKKFCAQTDLLIQFAAEHFNKEAYLNGETDSLRVSHSMALWVRRMFTLLQPMIDGNTRMGRIMYFRTLKSIEHHLNKTYPYVTLKTADIGAAELMNASTSFEYMEHPHELSPFSSDSEWDLKGDLNRWYTWDMFAFSREKTLTSLGTPRKRLKVQFDDLPTIQANHYTTVVTEGEFKEKDLDIANLATEWETVRSFYEDQITNGTPINIVNHPAIAEEATLLLNYLKTHP